MNKTFKNESQSGIRTIEILPEVKETLYNSKDQGRHITFSAADLWNIQRQTKYRVTRKFI